MSAYHGHGASQARRRRRGARGGAGAAGRNGTGRGGKGPRPTGRVSGLRLGLGHAAGATPHSQRTHRPQVAHGKDQAALGQAHLPRGPLSHHFPPLLSWRLPSSCPSPVGCASPAASAPRLSHLHGAAGVVDELDARQPLPPQHLLPQDPRLAVALGDPAHVAGEEDHEPDGDDGEHGHVDRAVAVVAAAVAAVLVAAVTALFDRARRADAGGTAPAASGAGEACGAGAGRRTAAAAQKLPRTALRTAGDGGQSESWPLPAARAGGGPFWVAGAARGAPSRGASDPPAPLAHNAERLRVGECIFDS